MDLSLLLRSPHDTVPLEVVDAVAIAHPVPDLELLPGDMLYTLSDGRTLMIRALERGQVPASAVTDAAPGSDARAILKRPFLSFAGCVK